MHFSHLIEKYRLYYYGKRSRDGEFIAVIGFYNDRDQYLGRVRFYRDGQVIPSNSSDETTNPQQASLTMHERQLDTVVDMLRNEKPCYVVYSTPTIAYIRTGNEPVGEEESKG